MLGTAITDPERPFVDRGVWYASVGTPALCSSCSNRAYGERLHCRADPQRTIAWSCRDWSYMPGAFG